MNELPPVQARNVGRPPDDLDRILYAFMREEIPNPWPVMKAPAHSVPVPLPVKSRSWPRLNSRFALAATVACCLVGSVALKSLFPAGERSPADVTKTPDIVISQNGFKVKVTERGNLKDGLEIKIEPVDLPGED